MIILRSVNSSHRFTFLLFMIAKQRKFLNGKIVVYLNLTTEM